MNARAASPKPAPRAVATPPRRKTTCGSAASAGQPHRRHGKRPAPKPLKSLPLPRIHDPRERLTATRLVRLREQLRLDVAQFSRVCGVPPALLISYEAQERPWPADRIAAAMPRLSEACASAQNAIEDAVGLIAELEQEARW